MSIIQGFLRIPRSMRHIKRYREIAFILIKYGLGDIIGYTKTIGLGIFKPKKYKGLIDIKRASTYERIRMAIEDLGPTFVKFGQVMSNRPDIFPETFIYELEKLQKNVAPFPFEMVNQILDEELMEKKDAFFLEIDPVPLASASIAQVHKATLKTGEKVVLKIQRPNISRIIETDVEIMLFLAKKIQKRMPEFSGIDAVAIINEFRATIKRELDFNQEISHIERFQHNFKDDKDIYVPKIHKEFCCKNIIVLEFIDGYTINDLLTKKDLDIDPIAMAKKGANFILKQIFTYGFFHADPHPGNILVLPDKRICFIDFGMTGTLPVKYRTFLADMILGFVNQDAGLIVKILKRFAIDEMDINSDELEYRIGELVEEFTYMPLNKIDSAAVLQKLLDLLVHFRLKLPPVVYMLLKAIIIIEGVGRKLDPEFNITEYVKPFAKKLLRSKMDPVELVKKNYTKGIDLVKYLAEFPEIAFDIAEMLREGKIRIGVEHKGLSPIIENNRQGNQMVAFAIVAAAIIIGSSLIIMTKIPPLWHNLSISGLIGYALAALFILLIFRKGQKKK